MFVLCLRYTHSVLVSVCYCHISSLNYFTVGFTAGAAYFMGADILRSHDQLNMTCFISVAPVLASFICGRKVIMIYCK